ncbi:aminotransferase class I/II-fold pyridoxal phosphate-dependent enzyme [Rapidithrix thailandica]|uniref:GDP-perosamine synthase n=1 Tax=Rapidithrix thailandica TaxID=413964 RepID=A0AAW9SK97_9BACT
MSTKPKIWLSSPHMGEKEFEFVKEAFETNWIAPLGPHVNGFEEDLQRYTNTKHAAALSSGTGALHLALILLGVQRGDEVLCQSFTFCGSANPITYQGATPVFIDSEKDTWNISPEFLEEAIKDRIQKGKKPKAIVYVHLYGMPAKVDEIRQIAASYEIPLVEDAAEALGSTYKGQACGSLGDLSILSFNGNKIITTSGGGALLSNNKEWIEKARFLATQARDVAPHYQHSEIGFNYRMSNVCAGIGRGQMQVIDQRVNQRRKVFEFYQEIFKNSEGITLQQESSENFSNRWLSCILIDPSIKNQIKTETILQALADENIEGRPLWKPMHLQPVFEKAPFYGDGTAEILFQTGLCLPSGSNMTEEDLSRISQVLDHLL